MSGEKETTKRCPVECIYPGDMSSAAARKLLGILKNDWLTKVCSTHFIFGWSEEFWIVAIGYSIFCLVVVMI